MKAIVSPELEKLIVSGALYSSLEALSFDANTLLFANTFRIHCYCTGCRQESVFVNVGANANPLIAIRDMGLKDKDQFVLKMECQKNTSHQLGVTLLYQSKVLNKPSGPTVERNLTKTGQFPSVIDLANETYRHLKSHMSDVDYTELNRAVGLASHGVGVGAFVYLRRIFERYVFALAEEAEVDKEAFAQFRMGEKLKVLKHELPEILVENKQVYGLLSMGVHQASEKECLANFEAMKDVILLIFEEIKLKKELEDRRRKLTEHLKTATPYTMPGPQTGPRPIRPHGRTRCALTALGSVASLTERRQPNQHQSKRCIPGAPPVRDLKGPPDLSSAPPNRPSPPHGRTRCALTTLGPAAALSERRQQA